MYIHVRVIAGSKKESIEKTGENRFKISVKEKAERNMANRRVMLLLARWHSIPAGKVLLVGGHTSPSKIFSL
jgi:uncharacterized protein YggU (UPF0235/DUF167 family)